MVLDQPAAACKLGFDDGASLRLRWLLSEVNDPQLTPTAVVLPTLTLFPALAPLPVPPVLPVPQNTTCAAPQWSLSLSQGWWRQSYCPIPASASCAGSSPRKACSLTVPAFAELPSNLQGVLLATGCTFNTNGSAAQLRSDMCSCITNPPKGAGAAPQGETQNRVAFVFNVLLARQGDPTATEVPTTCARNTTYTPLAQTYVCTVPGSSAACGCPTGPVWMWNNSASPACQEYVNAQAVHEGKCMPASTADLPNCQVQACACGAGPSGQEQPGALPSPSPNTTVTPSPSPSNTSSPSPSPTDRSGAVPSPSPAAASGATKTETASGW